MRLIASPPVQVTTVTSTSIEDCENCGARFAGCNGIHWTAQDEPAGLLNVCDHRDCLDYALRTALDDAPEDTVVTCERSVYPNEMEVAA